MITGINIDGFVKIYDPITNEILVDKKNAIHYENFSEALALSVANKTTGYIFELHFGNGGSSVSSTGTIVYLPLNITGSNADLYNSTYFKIVDDTSSLNTDVDRSNMEIRHMDGAVYTDVVVNCLLDYGEPAGQSAFDNSTTLNDEYVFDEIGLKSWNPTDVADNSGLGQGKLLTHAIFHPVQKALNRLIAISYTIRIQTLTASRT